MKFGFAYAKYLGVIQKKMTCDKKTSKIALPLRSDKKCSYATEHER
jgi:hypothetical protein